MISFVNIILRSIVIAFVIEQIYVVSILSFVSVIIIKIQLEGQETGKKKAKIQGNI